MIKKYTVLQLESLGSKEDQKKNDIYRATQGARTLARLVIEVRKDLPCISLDSLKHPAKSNLTIKATKALSFGKGSSDGGGKDSTSAWSFIALG